MIDNDAPDRSSVHHALVVRLKNREIAAPGRAFAIGPSVTARVLYPPAGLKAKAADDQALVMQLIIDRKHRILLLSDSGAPTERAAACSA